MADPSVFVAVATTAPDAPAKAKLRRSQVKKWDFVSLTDPSKHPTQPVLIEKHGKTDTLLKKHTHKQRK